MTIILLASLVAVFSVANAEPIKGCNGLKGNYFVADSDNPCIYYWCEDGQFLQWIFPCSYGAAVPYGYFGQIVPCIDNRRTCYGGAPKRAIIREPALGNGVFPYTSTTVKGLRSTQSPLNDDSPTLSHKQKHVEQKTINWHDRHIEREHKDTKEPSQTTGLPQAATTTPKYIVKIIEPSTSTTRDVPSTTGRPMHSGSTSMDGKSTPMNAHGGEFEPKGNRMLSPTMDHELTSPRNQLETDDQRMLISEEGETSSDDGMMKGGEKSTEANMKMDPTPMLAGKGDSMDRTTTFHMNTERITVPIRTTDSPTMPPSSMSVIDRSTTRQPITITTPTTPKPTTTTTITTTTTTRARPTTTSPMSTTTSTEERSSTPSTTPSTRTREMTTRTTTPDEPLDEFDFGFESQRENQESPESLPRVIDHEGSTEAEVIDKQKILNENSTEDPTTPRERTESTKETPPTRVTQSFVDTTSTTRAATTPTATTTTATYGPFTTRVYRDSPTPARVSPSTTTTTERPSTTTTLEMTTPTSTTAAEPEITRKHCDEEMPMRGGGQVITEVFPQHHIRGGNHRTNFTFQIGVIHVTLEIKMASLCYLACDLHPGCAGFDWNIEDASCWFHTEAAECNSTVDLVGGPIAHYRLEACGMRGAPVNSESFLRTADEQVKVSNDVKSSSVSERLQADETAYEAESVDDGAEWESGSPQAFDMVINHGRNREAAGDTESGWEHGS